ncbi:acyl-[acyl-carrier-protein] thioesterase [Gordonia sp. VNK21]|uniref:acyl-[acyl-carrier-protein] thioesterase n=1 Tax=Gordonia sp. VNK21 TaxID=3382483 RepID=UPI0038D4274F
MTVPTPTNLAAPQYRTLPERKADGPVFETVYRVRTGDVDQQMRARLDALARYLQDAANDNLRDSSFAESEPFWIVRRTVIDVLEPITWPSEVHVQRWCGAYSTRWTNMRITLRATSETNRFNPELRPDGLVETEAFWINVNDQGLPSRICDETLELLGEMTDVDRLRWKAMNPEKAPEHGDRPDREHVLRVSDFDPFRHLNNAAYLEAVEDELADHAELLDGPHRLVIEYLRPIVPQTPITVRRMRIDDCLFLWLLIPGDDGGLVVASSVSLSRIPS